MHYYRSYEMVEFEDTVTPRRFEIHVLIIFEFLATVIDSCSLTRDLSDTSLLAQNFLYFT